MWSLDEASRQLRGAYQSGVKLVNRNGGIGYSLLPTGNNTTTTSYSRNRKIITGVSISLSVIAFYYGVLWIFAPAPSAYPGLPLTDREHPILRIVSAAETTYQAKIAAQSTTLDTAVREYERRYGMPPPPHFDRWFQFAQEHQIELIDEYDSIFDSLRPFWGLAPDIVRQRTREALGYDNSLMGVSLRAGELAVVGNGQDEFQVPATREMISPFLEWLPDMDLAFNVNDEPRVVVPHEDLTRLMTSATAVMQSVKAVRTAFSTPGDLGSGKSYDRVSESLFNHLDHQQTFAHARMSCPPDSPARSLDPDVKDIQTGILIDGITFVDNITEFSDICLAPSTRRLIGLFNHPNVFAVSHDLVAVFSPSKLSTFHDILYPSPYYYADKSRYNDDFAVQWENKAPNMYWRGATSGGYSQGGSWRTSLRQSIVSKLTTGNREEENVRVLGRKDGSKKGRWVGKDVARSNLTQNYDLQFTEIKQCDANDCSEMRQLFGTHPHAPQEESWKNRYLLDMDGNALSGRFYALLKSLSLPLKVAYFREWHNERIFPWKHYVPLTATTDEYAEILRYLEHGDDNDNDNGRNGRNIAQAMALEGREWINKVARKEDLQAYMFRLLLEYGRVIDDHRAELGFAYP